MDWSVSRTNLIQNAARAVIAGHGRHGTNAAASESHRDRFITS
jgi:hypothetical protein